MPALHDFVDGQIRLLEQRLRGYLGGAISAGEMAGAADSVIEAWNALPQDQRHGVPEAHEDVLWHAVWTTRELGDEARPGGGTGDPLLHEALHLLESRAPLPQHYTVRRPGH